MKDFNVLNQIGWNREAFDYLLSQMKGEGKADFLKGQILKYQLPQEEFKELHQFFQRMEEHWDSAYTSEEKQEIKFYFSMNYGELGCLAQFVLFYDDMLLDESFQEFANRLMNMDQNEINQGLLEKSWGLDNGMGEMVDGGEKELKFAEIDTRTILKCIGELQISDEGKWQVQEVYLNYYSHCKRVLALLEKTVMLLHKEESYLEVHRKRFVSYWTETLEKESLCSMLKTHLQLDIDYNPQGYEVYPVIMEMSSIKVMENGLSDSERSKTYFGLGILFGKSYNFSRKKENLQKHQDLFAIMKLLSDKSKFEILQFVAEDWKYGSEIVKETGLTAATISYHMNTLVQARLVDIKKEEKKVYFRQNREYLSDMLSFYEKTIQKK